jgi:hypothetical protein
MLPAFCFAQNKLIISSGIDYVSLRKTKITTAKEEYGKIIPGWEYSFHIGYSGFLKTYDNLQLSGIVGIGFENVQMGFYQTQGYSGSFKVRYLDLNCQLNADIYDRFYIAGLLRFTDKLSFNSGYFNTPSLIKFGIIDSFPQKDKIKTLGFFIGFEAGVRMMDGPLHIGLEFVSGLSPFITIPVIPNYHYNYLGLKVSYAIPIEMLYRP